MRLEVSSDKDLTEAISWNMVGKAGESYKWRHQSMVAIFEDMFKNQEPRKW